MFWLKEKGGTENSDYCRTESIILFMTFRQLRIETCYKNSSYSSIKADIKTTIIIYIFTHKNKYNSIGFLSPA